MRRNLRARTVGLRAAASKVAIAAAAIGVAAGGAIPAQAQDLVHRFIDPSFGGNPFYSDHLLATAAIDRPKEKTATTPTPTDEDLIAQQLRARLLAQLQGDILDQIQNAKVGDSGNFAFGNQTVTYTRTGTETRVTFTNVTTGESNTVVIPQTPAATGTTGTGTTVSTTEAARIAAAASSGNIAVTGSLTGVSSSLPSSALSSSARPSAEQVLSASGTTSTGSTGSVLPPY